MGINTRCLCAHCTVRVASSISSTTQSEADIGTKKKGRGVRRIASPSTFSSLVLLAYQPPTFCSAVVLDCHSIIGALKHNTPHSRVNKINLKSARIFQARRNSFETILTKIKPLPSHTQRLESSVQIGLNSLCCNTLPFFLETKLVKASFHTPSVTVFSAYRFTHPLSISLTLNSVS